MRCMKSQELVRESWNESLLGIRPRLDRLLYKGNTDLLFNELPRLAIVGSRKMSESGKGIIEEWMPELVKRGIVIVSGFMYGVDQTAHRACLDNGGKTVAVLGWGIDKEVCASERNLYQEILELDSLILSEYAGKMEGTRWSFPRRNRIVAGIVDAVLVIEAAEKSGSMITANLAERYGKRLLAVPGKEGDVRFGGTNRLIKSGKAVKVRSAEEVIEAMGIGLGQMKMGY